MPQISRFYGITVRVQFREHPPPHVHIYYSGHEASLDIGSLEVIVGHLPRRARLLVVEWALAHRTELEAAWDAAQRRESPDIIEPLG